MKRILVAAFGCGLALSAASLVYARGFGGAGGASHSSSESGAYHGGGESGGYHANESHSDSAYHASGETSGYHGTTESSGYHATGTESSGSAYHASGAEENGSHPSGAAAAGYHAGSNDASGSHPNGAAAAGYHAGSNEADGYHGGEYAAASGYHGALPTDAGFSAHPAATGAAAGAGAATYAGNHSVQSISGSQLAAQGATVRNAYATTGTAAFGQGWYGAHPGAWTAAGWQAGTAWRPATWAGVGYGLGWDAAVQPVVYNYGGNVTYQGDQVYYGDQPVASAGDYYQQAATIAQAPPPAAAPDDSWQPLGVFAMVQKDQDQPQIILQFAINKSGQLAGNYQDLVSDTTLPIHGAVDKKSQRVAWTVGSNKKNVAETGLYNLTKDESPVLMHQGADKTQQWLLIRLKQKQQDGQ